MKDYFIYPAIFTYDEDGQITIEFPDFNNCISQAENLDEASRIAKDRLALEIYDYQEDGQDLPSPTQFLQLQNTLDQNQVIALIDVWMPYHRSQIKNVYVKKTLTIPNDLDTLGKLNNINFSQLLQEALKEKLQLSDRENN